MKFSCCVPVRIPLGGRCSAPCALGYRNVPQPSDTGKPRACRNYYVPQPPCVQYYNSPCGAHERQKPPCLKKYDELCSIHKGKSSSLEKQKGEVSTAVCPQIDAVRPQMDAMCCVGSSVRQPINAMTPGEYSGWGKCQLPAQEIERQIREKREEEQRMKKQKEKEKRTRQILKEKRMEYRPQCPPPRNMNHRAEVPCEHCEPTIPKEKPKYPPTEAELTGPICPPMELRHAMLKNVQSRELKGGVMFPDCNCMMYNGLQDD